MQANASLRNSGSHSHYCKAGKSASFALKNLLLQRWTVGVALPNVSTLISHPNAVLEFVQFQPYALHFVSMDNK